MISDDLKRIKDIAPLVVMLFQIGSYRSILSVLISTF